MSPADELRAAAKKLRKRGREATPGPWDRPLDVRNKAVVTAAKPDDEDGRYLDGRPERVGVVKLNTWSNGEHMRKRGGRDLEWIAMMHPGLAEPLAVWLESVADEAEAHEARGWGNDQTEIATSHILAIADVINGGTS